MAFWIILAIIVAGLYGYMKVFGKPCDCQEKAA